MNIVLLSGGSGKRLWPLSNDTRSKQFLRLLKNEEGEYESMVQRVYRQITTVCPDSGIVVATGASQVDSIQNHLGGQVDIVIEPERRDTFPAIALSSAYLAMEKKVPLDEVVLVLPVDPYVEIGYFETLVKMEKAVQDGVADILLMGITPTYPSAKYGYIVPKNGELVHDARPVARFTEKPTEEKAKILLEDGAVWNGGVFAFKLGYMMEIVKKYCDCTTYKELLGNYSSFKKISFDYEVVEKAESVAMIPYDGEWKDLGTWNTLTEVMDSEYMGNATIGENTTGTNVINELSIPVVVLGATDLIVAASPDGILISDKNKSSYLKSYVDHIGERPMFEERTWGEAKIIDLNQYEGSKKSITKRLSMKSGQSLSYQKHTVRDEIWTFVAGTGDLLIDGHMRNVHPGDVAYIHKGQKHSVRAITDLHFIEVQIGEELAINDVEYSNWEW
ncbi:sugar phosphate nucleotidyltransferase [Youngiibacter multivorans]|uniref:Mannose-1-phosphate guanylyltransferase n=1 Tax=Youngiibacter multivorans TaxID=937251 RepID=A0ABS4G6D7_9CLOT|nr:sugar phosphate nucleotidyltransferase [Youngiibacter multivorans]MBP1920107.1 mannose-1-phosphate guanylyltransferase [Youngiibacter multivorans]